MHLLRRNRKTIYYKQYSGKTAVVDDNGFDTGEYTITYGTIQTLKAYVSPSSGNAKLQLFGVDTVYSKVIITDDMSCPINENTILWIDSATTNEHNYVVSEVAKSLNHIAIAVKEVSVG